MSRRGSGPREDGNGYLVPNSGPKQDQEGYLVPAAARQGVTSAREELSPQQIVINKLNACFASPLESGNKQVLEGVVLAGVMNSGNKSGGMATLFSAFDQAQGEFKPSEQEFGEIIREVTQKNLVMGKEKYGDNVGFASDAAAQAAAKAARREQRAKTLARSVGARRSYDQGGPTPEPERAASSGGEYSLFLARQGSSASNNPYDLPADAIGPEAAKKNAQRNADYVNPSDLTPEGVARQVQEQRGPARTGARPAYSGAAKDAAGLAQGGAHSRVREIIKKGPKAASNGGHAASVTRRPMTAQQLADSVAARSNSGGGRGGL